MGESDYTNPVPENLIAEMTANDSAKIKMILFDLGNVIVKFSHDRACEQMAKVAGTTTEEVHKALFDQGLQEQYETGRLSSEEFLKQFNSAVGCSAELEPLLLAGSDIFWLNSSIVPLIAQLGAAGVRIGILSNTCSAHWEFVLKNFPLVERRFDETVLSYEVHSMKPDPGIYKAAIQMAGCSPDEIFFMDDRQENVTGACEAGIDAVLYESTAVLYRQLRQRGVQINL